MLFKKSVNHDIGVWYDIHSHFLPGIDDGCQTAAESAELLHLCKQQGVAGMIATPHYYPQETVDAFIGRRQAAIENLGEYLSSSGTETPDICYGAEVAYFQDLLHQEGLERLCLGNSSYILLELPFGKWDSKVISDINKLENVLGLTVIIAHLERYLDLEPESTLDALYNLNVIIQMNGSYILEKDSRRSAIRRAKNGYVQLLGSDTHNLDMRRPNLTDAAKVLADSIAPEDFEYIRGYGEAVFTRAFE